MIRGGNHRAWWRQWLDGIRHRGRRFANWLLKDRRKIVQQTKDGDGGLFRCFFVLEELRKTKVRRFEWIEKERDAPFARLSSRWPRARAHRGYSLCSPSYHGIDSAVSCVNRSVHRIPIPMSLEYSAGTLLQREGKVMKNEREREILT